jgi:hypothetical protein
VALTGLHERLNSIVQFYVGVWEGYRGAGEQGAVRWNHNIELSVDRLRFMNSIVHFDRGIGRKTKVVGVMVSVI